MKYIQFALFTLFLFCLTEVKAQQNHFIYIQTENTQPFYVKLDNRLYSSSSSGYVVVPKLKEGTYNLAIGFPKSELAEHNLVCTIHNKDVGYLLKNFEEKGWGLYNLQTFDVVMSGNKEKANTVEVVTKTDAFSTMLSNVVNDSTIRQSETMKEEEKIDTATALENVGIVSNTTLNSKPAQPGGESLKDGSATPNKNATAITRSLYINNSDGTEMVFMDEVNGKIDTIRVFIPVDKNSITLVEEKPKNIEEPIIVQKTDAVKPPEVKTTDTRFLEIELPNSNKKPTETKSAGDKAAENKDIGKVDTGDPAANPDKPVSEKDKMINSDCKNFATDEDFMKLRKKMASEDNDDDMLTLAKKSFKTKCFTVDQVKNLSVLFLKDGGKYAFFDVAYPFVSDSHNFTSLQNQLSETYYIDRFQVMIRH